MVCILLLNKTNENMLIVRQCWVLFFFCELLFAGVYSIRYEEESNGTVESRQLQSGFFPSELIQNGNSYGNGDYSANSDYNVNSNSNGNSNSNYNGNNQYQNGNSLQFPSNENQGPNSQFQNIQDNSIFNSGEYYVGDQPQYQNNFNEVRPVQVPNRESTDVQYFANQDRPSFQNTNRPITSYYQPSNPVPFQPNLQNPPPNRPFPPPNSSFPPPNTPFPPPNRPFPPTQQSIGPFQRPQRPLGPVNNIPRPPGQYQQNYAGNFNNYETTSNPITNFISNIGQGAADFFGGGSNNYNRPNGPPPQFDSFNRPIRPNINGPNRPPGPGPFNSPFGTIEQLGKAIDEITRNDDFQCIPKVICQMFGNQRQQSSYSSILGSPIFSGLIAAVPSSSAGLVYGRAALLGYTSGESTCNGAYPKCPKNEDDLLYYLNNHRGGFFRFFNGGASFGDDSNYNYNQNNHQPVYQNNQNNQNNQYNQNFNQQQQQQQQHSPQQSALSNLATLQNLADVINQSDGINLSNIASNGGLLNNLAGLVGGNSDGAADLLSGLISGGGSSGGNGASGILNSLITGGNVQSAPSSGGTVSLLSGLAQNSGAASNIGSVVGNLLTGFIGNRFSSRKLSKRSVNEDVVVNVTSSKEERSDKENENNASGSTDLKTHKTIVFDVSGDVSSNDNSGDELIGVEPRIVHGKLPILSEVNQQSHDIKFTDEPEGTPREEKEIKFNDNSENKKTNFLFPPNTIQGHNEIIIFPTSNDASLRISKKIKFVQKDENLKIPFYSKHFFPTDDDDVSNHQPLNEINDIPQRIKMVFPNTDRTGTGNLIFDSNKFDTATGIRIGKILSGLHVLQQLQHLQQGQQSNTNSNQILFDTTNSNRYDANSNYNTNPLYTLEQSNDRYQQSFPNRYTTNQQASNHRFGNQNYNINYNSQSSYNGRPSSSDGDSSQNVYVTNGKGVVEYYINSAGVKVNV